MIKINTVQKVGVLLVNLGTPDSPETPDVRKYLKEFLIDERVIDIPFYSRWPLVNLIIAPFRAPKSAKIYKELWTDNGSPLKYYAEQNVISLQKDLGDSYIVKMAMRYQSPSIENVLEEFKTSGVKKLIILPLFPHYASASTGSVYQKVFEILAKWQAIPEIDFVNYFYNYPKFIEAFAKNAQKYIEKYNYEHFLFSYHGLPERQITKGDCFNHCKFDTCCDVISEKNQLCYRAQCFATTRLLVEALNLKKGTYTTCFQSRLGSTPWIKPYSDVVIEDLGKKGIKSVLAFSPAFISDCLETTIEVGVEYKEIFEKNGGEKWDLVESLNNEPIWIDLLSQMVRERNFF